MRPPLPTLNDVRVAEKTVLVRIDANSPYDEATGRIIDSERLRAHAKTLRELSNNGARIVVLTHQGREGSSSFVGLGQHASLLSGHIGRGVIHVPDLVGDAASGAIDRLKSGDILLLDNVRFLEEETESRSAEEHSESLLVTSLAPLCRLFVFDAFSVAHRAHASVIGFIPVLPSVVGRVMEVEMAGVDKALNPERPNVFILGGNKVEDCLEILHFMLDRKIVDTVLTAGVLGELSLISLGRELGEATMAFLESRSFLDSLPGVDSLLNNHGDVVNVPVDVVYDHGGRRKEARAEELPVMGQILDVGVETAKAYSTVIGSAKNVVVKGPAGVYERQGFERGTREI
ncbi:MAG: phosphoglycerate kinase, partial [Candidatus Geothermarchaeales archaeon]